MLIVAGVFVGLEASNWNEARQDRELERQSLQRLRWDLADSAQRLRGNQARYSMKQGIEQRLALAFDRCSVDEDERADIELALNVLGIVQRAGFRDTTYEELIAAGRLVLISNRAVAQELSGVAAHFAYVETLRTSIAPIALQHRAYVDAHVRFLIDEPMEAAGLRWGRHVTVDFSALCGTPELANRVSAISLLTGERASHFEDLAEHIERVIPLIDDELRVRWAVEPAAALRSE